MDKADTGQKGEGAPTDGNRGQGAYHCARLANHIFGSRPPGPVEAPARMTTTVPGFPIHRTLVLKEPFSTSTRYTKHWSSRNHSPLGHNLNRHSRGSNKDDVNRACYLIPMCETCESRSGSIDPQGTPLPLRCRGARGVGPQGGRGKDMSDLHPVWRLGERSLA